MLQPELNECPLKVTSVSRVFFKIIIIISGGGGIFNADAFCIFVYSKTAVGKSTFASLLQSACPDWEVMTEPVSMWQNIQTDNSKVLHFPVSACLLPSAVPGVSPDRLHWVLWQDAQGGSTISNLLQMMYQDPQRWSYTFQTYACMSRLKTQLQPPPAQLLASEGAPVQVYERSVYSDRSVISGGEGALCPNPFKSSISWKRLKGEYAFFFLNLKFAVSCQIHLCPEHVWAGLYQLHRVDHLPGLALLPGGEVWTPVGAGGHHLPESPARGITKHKPQMNHTWSDEKDTLHCILS